MCTLLQSGWGRAEQEEKAYAKGQRGLHTALHSRGWGSDCTSCGTNCDQAAPTQHSVYSEMPKWHGP